MNAQVGVVERTLTFPAQLFRRVIAPAALSALGALLMAAVTFVLKRTREPALPRMSDEWLRTHDRGYDEWRLY